MRYGFINNFEQILAQAVSDTATSITLDGGGSQMSDASADLVYVLTLYHVDSNGNETAREIVHVTGVSGDTLMVTRAQERTTAQAWTVGDGVSQRLTAGVLGAAVYNADPLIAGVNAYGNPAAGSVILSGGLGASGDSTRRNIVIGDGEGVGQDAVIVGFDNYPSSGDYVLRIGTSNGGSGDRSVAIGDSNSNSAAFTISVGANNSPSAERAVALGQGNYPSGFHALSIGVGCYAGGDHAVSAGSAVQANGIEACAVGRSATAGGDYGVAYGSGSAASALNAMAMGRDSQATGKEALAAGRGAAAAAISTAVGSQASASSQSGPTTYGGVAVGEQAGGAAGCVAIGSKASGVAPVGIAVGGGASSTAPENMALGHESSASAPYSVALGRSASAGVVGGFQLNALSYMPSAVDDTGTYAGPPPSATRRSSQQVTIATDPLDLTDGAAAVTLDLPVGTMLFIDAVDIVITGSDTAGGSPEISVGPDDVTPAAYLASTPVTKTAVGGRESHTPLVADGKTSLRVATSVAGTGTTYQAKVVFRGYVMEL